jgi:cytoskeletal protein RodZ
MNSIKKLSVVIFFVLFGAFAWSQAMAQDEPKPQQEQPETKPTKPERDDHKAQEDQVKPPKDKEEAPDKVQPKDKQPEAAGKPEKSEAAQGQEHARPSGKSAHIPDDKFKANFGRQHTFTATQVITEKTVVVNQTQFVYGGYTFVFLDPWPSAWMFTDPCYVDYVGGEYVLIDVLHPGMQIALFVQG